MAALIEYWRASPAAGLTRYMVTANTIVRVEEGYRMDVPGPGRFTVRGILSVAGIVSINKGGVT